MNRVCAHARRSRIVAPGEIQGRRRSFRAMAAGAIFRNLHVHVAIYVALAVLNGPMIGANC